MIGHPQQQVGYGDVLTWLENQGRAKFGSHFTVLTDDQPVIIKLAAYFFSDAATAQRLGLNLEKGLIVSGPVGSGKTALMKLMKQLSGRERQFLIKPCRDVSFEFIAEGYPVIHKYASGKTFQSGPGNVCFDDLGAEGSLKYYGNECNVMAEVLLSRYDLYIEKKITTHITTNLAASEIEKQYGTRVRSRLREMCNLIAFPSHTKDKRI